MLRKLLIATALLAVAGASFAHGGSYGSGYGQVVRVEPQFVISYGSRYPDGFRVLYESGGTRYWTHTPYYPAPVIVLPPPHRVQLIHGYRDSGHGGYERRHDRRHDWRDDRRDDRRHDRY